MWKKFEYKIDISVNENIEFNFILCDDIIMCKFFGYCYLIGDNSFFILNKLKLWLIIIVFINFLKYEMILYEFLFVIFGVYCDMKCL